MNVGLGVAGVISVLLAFGHQFIGVTRVLPSLTNDRGSGSPGPASLTVAMVRVTWYIVTIFAATSGVILMMLAWTDANPKTLLLRTFAVMWIAATVMAFFALPRGLRLRNFARLPVPLFWVVIAVLCWWAST